MTINNKVWILDDKGLTHDDEFAAYEQHGIEWKLTATKNYQEDLELFGQYADAVVTQVGFPCDDKLIEQLRHCKAIFSFGMGFNAVDLDAARKHNIDVCHLPDYCLEEVADHTLALILALVRKLQHHNQSVKHGKWNPVLSQPVHRLSNMTIGLYGFGKIARKVAHRLRAFGCKLIAYDDYVPESVFEENDVHKVNFTDMLGQSNILSLHVPLTRETKNSLNYDELRKLPENGIVINTCRGGVVNEPDLLQLIQEKHLSGAGLDVLETEPPEADNPLTQHEDIIISPHAAYFSNEAEKELQMRTEENVRRVMKREKPLYIIN